MIKNNESTSSIYLMHKYWGKKPSEALREFILKYTDKNDLVLDPFAGFGGIAIESLLLNRNVIINDLNPAAVFISKCVLDETVNIDKLKELFESLKKDYQTFQAAWYSYCGAKIVTILRTKNDVPIKIRIQEHINAQEKVLTADEQQQFLDKENHYQISTWVPGDILFTNSRISVKSGMRVSDLFPKRALICQSFLYSLIEQLRDCPEKDLLKLAFTSNLANCSKLVPPIKSRGDMAQGAWMTGFYVGETYLENNVFHYFENRVAKIIKGKKDYLQLRLRNQVQTTYSILNEDAKQLHIDSESTDFVFTDFPYGDTVPYFEQSQLWNFWLKNRVDYENEIVISDSSDRNKDLSHFEQDIQKSIGVIHRVLKNEKYFVFTFHSLLGQEWGAIVKALKQCGFEFVECDVVVQKTLPPRQLNRTNSIKGDIVAVYKKVKHNRGGEQDFYKVLKQNIISMRSKREIFEVNDIIRTFVKSILETSFSEYVEFGELIDDYFVLDPLTNKWRIKNELLRA